MQIPLTLTRTKPCPGLLEAVKSHPGVWLCVLSRTGVMGMHEALQSLPEPERPQVACVGAGTASHLTALGWKPRITGVGGAEALLRLLVSKGIQGPVFLAKGNRPSPGLEAAQKQGLQVEAFEVYENVEPEEAPAQVAQELKSCQAICLASPSAVERLMDSPMERRTKGPMPHILSIGATTTKALTQRGWKVFQECEPPLFSEFATGISRLLTLEGTSS